MFQVSEAVVRGPFLRHMAPHHPLLAGLDHAVPSESSSGYMTNTSEYPPRHRHLHHRSSSHAGPGLHAGSGGPSGHHVSSYNQATSGRMPQAMPLNTFGGSGPDIMSTPSEQRENEKQSLFGTNIDFSLGSKSAPVTSGNSPTQSLSQVCALIPNSYDSLSIPKTPYRLKS